MIKSLKVKSDYAKRGNLKAQALIQSLTAVYQSLELPFGML